MEQIIQKILEMNPFVVYVAVFFFAFIPGSYVVRIRKLNRWVKTMIVLIPGEFGAIALWVLVQAAKEADAGNILAEFTPFAIFFAVFALVYAIVGHMFNWDHRIVKGLKKENNEQ